MDDTISKRLSVYYMTWILQLQESMMCVWERERSRRLGYAVLDILQNKGKCSLRTSLILIVKWFLNFCYVDIPFLFQYPIFSKNFYPIFYLFNELLSHRIGKTSKKIYDGIRCWIIFILDKQQNQHHHCCHHYPRLIQLKWQENS